MSFHSRLHTFDSLNAGDYIMGPAYLLSSLYLWLAGGRPYRDIPFEREAYDLGG